VAVLVDTANWQWRGRRWAHLVSDVSFEELHDFARLLGKRRLGFQGDHYDVDQDERLRAVSLGAEPVDSRELVGRLRHAGLRRRNAKPSWQRLGYAGPGTSLEVSSRLVTFGEPGMRLREALRFAEGLDRLSRSALYVDEVYLVALFDWVGPAASLNLPMLDQTWAGEPRVDGERSLELFVARELAADNRVEPRRGS